MGAEPDERALENLPYGLRTSVSAGARAVETAQGAWRLEIPAGPKGRYRLAQLDDYGSLKRRDFPRRASFRMALRARASEAVIPGTWGFGVWNNPFGMALLSGAEALRLPAMPNAAWCFYASPPNYLSLRDDLPAQGWLAATFRSPGWATLLAVLGAPALPLLALPPTARLLRRVARRFVGQAAEEMHLDPTAWHSYELEWTSQQVVMRVNGAPVLDTAVSPLGPLGIVIWVDNQYAALPPSGRPGFGTLENPQPAWIEIDGLHIEE